MATLLRSGTDQRTCCLTQLERVPVKGQGLSKEEVKRRYWEQI